MELTKYKPWGTTRRLKQLIRDRVGCQPDSPNISPRSSNSKSEMSCRLRPTQAQGRRVRGDQSPETRRGGGVERELDLAKIDGSAGVRKSRENMGNVIEKEDAAVGG